MILTKKNTARLAGLLFLILITTGIFAEFFVRQKIFVTGDIVTTSKNIINNEWLFRLGFVSDLVMSSMFFFYAFLLYLVFKNLYKEISLFMLFCVVISVAMYCQNMLNQFSAFELLHDPNYSNAFRAEQLQGLSTFFLKMHTKGYFVNQIFFGMYLFPLGYMIFKSGVIPKVIGALLMLGCVGDLIDFVVYFMDPGNDSIILQNITIPADIGEISLCLWLLIMGVRDKKLQDQE
ncbi:DUF4386 domain-containing protein [Aquimarina mytili]|uniref:DUF4386 domain-containing protein n=1 Tax=Aquimarina mytili TaxID=874423 RepID=A0A936ZY15_9FLAO|nr:DUF4386 domain-containing protein [Aquimarina mytili]MBL0683985.1 DUF4386 domain-containing protein [Aquimarina mytili]